MSRHIKTIAYIFLIALAAQSALAQFALGTSYQIDILPRYGASHFDFYDFIYTPGSGWANRMTWGQDTEVGSSRFTVTQDDGGNGAPIALQITLNYDMAWKFETPRELQVDLGDNAPTMQSNFAGWNSFSFAFPVLGDLAIPPLTATDDGSGSLTYTMDSTTGAINNVYFHLGHGEFLPTGLQVFDPNQPAAFGVYVYSDLQIANVDISSVPDSASTLCLLALALAGLPMLRCRSPSKKVKLCSLHSL
jgi:hypothetical protein